jgi:hypothetical protein
MSKREMIEAAKRYAASDASDPFAFNRAMTHLANGVASYANKDGNKGYYDAELHHEPRAIVMPNGKTLEWQAEVYRNIYRP